MTLRARPMAKRPELIGNVLAQLMARRGFARVRSASACEAAWRKAAGEMAARYTRVGGLSQAVSSETPPAKSNPT